MSQAKDETVRNVERVKAEYVMGHRYEIWDVITDKERWWVITNPTNLYSQRHFPSLDYTLSFHVGLMMRVWRAALIAPESPNQRLLMKSFDDKTMHRNFWSKRSKLWNFRLWACNSVNA